MGTENLDGLELGALLERELASFTASSPENEISADTALDPSLASMRILDSPLVKFGAADDELFSALQRPEAVGPQMRLPQDWLGDACSVISYFFPASEQVRISNRRTAHASLAWFHARIEGQAFILSAGRFLVDLLEKLGYRAVCPAASPDIAVTMLNEAHPESSFYSNWSERHVAYVCGLGTFSLSKSLITEKGAAGRFGSVVTNAPLPVTPRPYSDLYEYCTRCGVCASNCPAGAISLETGKDHFLCFAEVTESKKRHPGYYGCGKCQTAVPCEHKNPSRR